MNPKISIIVPVYNVEGILKYCVDSILRQSFSDFEVLLIDDGSKDNSPALCDEYLFIDSRIKVFHKQNGGLSDARNYGIEHASGDNYLFIDSDDVLHKDFCKVLIDLQKKYNADITSTDLINFYDVNELVILDSKKYEYNEYVYKNEEILKEYYKPNDKLKIYHGLCMKLYKKDLFKNLRFEKGRLHEDLYITFQLLDKCNVFAFVDLPYYYYYQKNTNSITKNYKEKNLVDEYDALQNMLSYFSNRDEIILYLNYFTTYHFLYLLDRTYSLPKTSIIFEKRIQLKKWILENYKKLNNVSTIRKIKILLRVNFHFLYKLISLMKGSICHVK